MKLFHTTALISVALGATVTPALAQPEYPESHGSAIQIVCAPRILLDSVDTSMSIIGSQEGRSQYYYGPRDTLILNAGSDHGVQVGAEYFVQRIETLRTQFQVLKTVGWVRVVAVDNQASIAQVTEACDGMRNGDFLSPAVWPELSAASMTGEPDYANPAHVVFNPDGRNLIGTNQYAVIDRGTDAGLHSGQQLTVFRRTLGADGPVTELAKGIAVLVEADHATIRLTESRDAVRVGDLIAPHR